MAGQRVRAVLTLDGRKDAIAVPREAVLRGTATAANVPGIDAAGKTGTLPGPEGERKFAAFAPLSEPRWVLAVRTAGAGSASAAEIAGRVLARLLTRV